MVLSITQNHCFLSPDMSEPGCVCAISEYVPHRCKIKLRMCPGRSDQAGKPCQMAVFIHKMCYTRSRKCDRGGAKRHIIPTFCAVRTTACTPASPPTWRDASPNMRGIAARAQNIRPLTAPSALRRCGNRLEELRPQSWNIASRRLPNQTRTGSSAVTRRRTSVSHHIRESTLLTMEES